MATTNASTLKSTTNFSINLGHERYDLKSLSQENLNLIEEIREDFFIDSKLESINFAKRKYEEITAQFQISKEQCSKLKEEIEKATDILSKLQVELQGEEAVIGTVNQISDIINQLTPTIGAATFYLIGGVPAAIIGGVTYYLTSDQTASKLSNPSSNTSAPVNAQQDVKEVKIEEIQRNEEWYKGCAALVQGFKDEKQKAGAIKKLLVTLIDNSYSAAQVNIISQVAAKRLIDLQVKIQGIRNDIKNSSLSQKAINLITKSFSLLTPSGIANVLYMGKELTFSMLSSMKTLIPGGLTSFPSQVNTIPTNSSDKIEPDPKKQKVDKDK
ncbi:MAG: hypothetical protein JSR58_03925 [Verrucomicrobia bacterium]|nr:hypothetical protein [Verrucomicrobiota bacterium]